jgi:hypothetical protein
MQSVLQLVWSLAYSFYKVRWQPCEASVIPSKHWARVGNIWKFSPYLKENTTLHHYKDDLINAVQRSNCCLFWETYEIHKYKMQSYRSLKQPVHIVTTGFYSGNITFSVCFLWTEIALVLFWRQSWFFSLREQHRLRLFENWLVIRISGRREAKWRKTEENCITRRFIICARHRILLGQWKRRWAGLVARIGDTRNT